MIRRDLCPESDEHHDSVWFCLTCRMIEQRLRPIAEILKDDLADADLTMEFKWNDARMAAETNGTNQS